MSHSVLDENFRRLFKCCAPRLTADDIDRAFARFEGRRRPAPTHARVVAAAAAVLVLASVLGWLALSPRPKAAGAPAQESPEEVARLIADLGAASPEVREKAKSRLVTIGAAALGPLQRAIYHEDPEVRVQAQAVSKVILRAEEIRPTLAFIGAAVKIARARWIARNFADLESAIVEAFDPEEVGDVHYVARKTVGTTFYHSRGQGGGDSLTPGIVAALDRGDGIVYVDPKGNIGDLGPICIFTLPDKAGWSAYVTVDLLKRDPDDQGLKLVIAVENGAAEPLFKAATVATQPGGGLKIVDMDLKNDFGKVLKKGDVLRTVNGKPVAGIEDLRPLFEPSAQRVVLSIDRDGKVFSAGILALTRIVIKPSGVELEANKTFSQAQKAFDSDPEKALQLYAELLTKYASTEFMNGARKALVEERIGALKKRKSGDK